MTYDRGSVRQARVDNVDASRAEAESGSGRATRQAAER